MIFTNNYIEERCKWLIKRVLRQSGPTWGWMMIARVRRALCGDVNETGDLTYCYIHEERDKIL
jgi:hypothetical protein